MTAVVDALKELTTPKTHAAQLDTISNLITQKIQPFVDHAASTAGAGGGDIASILTQILQAILPGVPGSIIAIVVGFVVRFLATQIRNNRLSDHQSGANLNR
jgi:ABC-type phosphate/phosphonate transport system permease subunit